jgi:hypothetical protein
MQIAQNVSDSDFASARAFCKKFVTLANNIQMLYVIW